MTQTATRYNGLAQAFHWIVALLVITQFALAWSIPDGPLSATGKQILDLHMSIGATVLTLMVLRLLWRETHAVPPPPADLPRWQQVLSRTVQLLLYLVLIIQPLSGWFSASASGHTVRLFGGYDLPPLFAPSKQAGDTAMSFHAAVSTAILALVGLHVLGALRHAIFLRDGVMDRMLPGSGEP